jgi:hypothetical protein
MEFLSLSMLSEIELQKAFGGKAPRLSPSAVVVCSFMNKQLA